MQGVQVQSLVTELRSQVTCSQKNQNIKQKQHCDKFSRDFLKKWPTLKKKKKKTLKTEEKISNIFRGGSSKRKGSKKMKMEKIFVD